MLGEAPSYLEAVSCSGEGAPPDLGEGSLSDADKSQCASNPDAAVFLTSSYGYGASAILIRHCSFLPQQRNNCVVIANEIGHVCTRLFHVNPSEKLYLRPLIVTPCTLCTSPWSHSVPRVSLFKWL